MVDVSDDIALAGSSVRWEWIGYMAVALGMASMIPQLVQTYQTKSAADLSTAMIVLSLIAVFAWFVFGTANSITVTAVHGGVLFALWLALLVMKFYYSGMESVKKKKSV